MQGWHKGVFRRRIAPAQLRKPPHVSTNMQLLGGGAWQRQGTRAVGRRGQCRSCSAAPGWRRPRYRVHRRCVLDPGGPSPTEGHVGFRAHWRRNARSGGRHPRGLWRPGGRARRQGPVLLQRRRDHRSHGRRHGRRAKRRSRPGRPTAEQGRTHSDAPGQRRRTHRHSRHSDARSPRSNGLHCPNAKLQGARRRRMALPRSAERCRSHRVNSAGTSNGNGVLRELQRRLGQRRPRRTGANGGRRRRRGP
mmetsp:Transcript_84158/g.242997  ORF Transcript_84158/g.242997 Transcript_84158/m.242997 type:complete len:249 (+) Transcript_84158:238-984(+)